jgi:hypothetical protein
MLIYNQPFGVYLALSLNLLFEELIYDQPFGPFLPQA